MRRTRRSDGCCFPRRSSRSEGQTFANGGGQSEWRCVGLVADPLGRDYLRQFTIDRFARPRDAPDPWYW